jgi:hypothetical protein
MHAGVEKILGVLNCPFLSERVRGWLSDGRFEVFLQKNSGKVTKKLKTQATDDDQADVVAELEVARLLLKNARFELTYEPSGGKVAGPDFRVDSGHVWIANVEVKRLRLSQASMAIGQLTRDLIQKLRELPQVSYQFDMHVPDDTKPDPYRRMTRAFASEKSAIVAQCFEGVRSAVRTEFSDGATVSIPVADGRFSVRLSHSSGRDPKHRSGYLGGPAPIPYTQTEYKKILDEILAKVRQFPAGVPGAFAVVSHSDTHEDADFGFAQSILVEKAREHDDAFFQEHGVGSVTEFVELFRNMSVMAVQHKWARTTEDWGRFQVWHNPLAAAVLSPDHELVRQFERG